jgi:hypothetical protein
MYSFLTDPPSRMNINELEPAEVLQIDKPSLELLYQEVPKAEVAGGQWIACGRAPTRLFFGLLVVPREQGTNHPFKISTKAAPARPASGSKPPSQRTAGPLKG